MNRRVWMIAAFLLAVGVGVWLFLPRRGSSSDLTAATAANGRGVALMDQFRYAEAADAFRAAADAAPDWPAARVNLGIALYNRGGGSDDLRSQGSDLSLAAAEFRRVLATDPGNVHAHYNLGIVTLYLNDLAEANQHFARVTELDPADAHGWLLRARSLIDASESPAAKGYLETALRLNPYLNAARYALAQHALTDEAGRTRLLDEFTALMAGNADVEYVEKYTDMGRYSLCIGAPPAVAAAGPLPLFEPADPAVTPKPDWLPADKLDPLRKAVRSRFGGTLVRLDFDGDGKPDLLLLSATASGDLLLRNAGGKFEDVTAAAGLRGPGSLGAAVGDFDNDGRPDLALTGPNGVKLLRNTGGKFEDVTVAARLDKLTGVFLSAAWADLDQDGDLDLILCRYAAEATALTGGASAGGGLVVVLNVGEAKPATDKNAAPLAVGFRPAAGPPALLAAGPVTGVVVTDVDADGDPDLVVLIDDQPPAVVLNDRLGRYHAGPALPGVPAGRWLGGLVIDANGDDQSDLLLLPATGKPLLLVSTRDSPDDNLGTRFVPGPLDAPPLLQAQHIDLDLDGRPDLFGLAGGRWTICQGEGGGKLASRPNGLPDVVGLQAAAVCDLDGDCVPDLIGWKDTGLVGFRGRGTGSAAVRVALSGRRERREPGAGRVLRANADGLGSRVSATAGSVRTAVEFTTLSAGLGQSLLPLDLGIGKAKQADAIRVKWPDNMIQAELDQPACQLLLVAENNRKPTSCPVLFVWDGERFAYVTDFLGGGALGEQGPDGSVRPARPDEAVKIDPGRLVPRDGKYVLKIAEPMDEVLYLDHLRLDVVDHPADAAAFPDERFTTSGSPASGELLVFRDADRLFPVRATDHRGRDLTATLRVRDGRRADSFAVRSWLGYAEEHYVELDFGGKLPGGRLYLVLAGWTDYAYPESIFAATQAGVPTVAPVLEQRQPDGRWKPLGDLGFPAGLPRVITRDVTDLLDPAGGPLRIRTNLRVYWDQIFLAPVASADTARVVSLPVGRATLAHRGFVQEFSPSGKPPVEYDDSRVELVAVTPWHGQLTRTGDVTPLLAAADDRLVLCGPGDEVTVEFAAELPPPPAGWVRGFVLRTRGYCKDTAPTTLTGGRVGPLPFATMRTYPPDTPPPTSQAADERAWHTRPARGR